MSVVMLTMKATGCRDLVVVLEGSGGGGLRAGQAFGLAGLVQAGRCGDCASPPGERLCALMSNCVDVLGFFSGLVSCSQVRVEYSDGRCRVSFPDTAQRAASLALIYCMVYSECHFFSRFKYLLRYYPCITSPEALIHLIVTTGLIGTRLDGSGGTGSGLSANIARFNEKVRERLERVFESVRDLPGQDSLRNACQILQSVNYVTGQDADAFVREMGEGIASIREHTRP